MNIVQKRDIYGSWIEVLHAQQGHVAFEYYQTLGIYVQRRYAKQYQRDLFVDQLLT